MTTTGLRVRESKAQRSDHSIGHGFPTRLTAPPGLYVGAQNDFGRVRLAVYLLELQTTHAMHESTVGVAKDGTTGPARHYRALLADRPRGSVRYGGMGCSLAIRRQTSTYAECSSLSRTEALKLVARMVYTTSAITLDTSSRGISDRKR